MVGSQISFGIKPTHAEVDITDARSVRAKIVEAQPSAVINLAGLVDLQRAEDNEGLAASLNVDGAACVAQECEKFGIPLVHFSTCAVFDGSKDGPYFESDSPRPLNVYGRTKLEGECRVLSISPCALVVRTGWLFGGFDRDTRFVHACFERLSKGETVRATNDRFGSPTYIPDLIEAVVQLMNDSASGIVHVVNSSVASYFDIACAVNKIGKFEGEVIPVTFRDIESPGLARGKMEALASERGVQMRNFHDALTEYIFMLKQSV